MSDMIKIYCYNYNLCNNLTMISTSGYDDRFGTYPLENLTNNFNPISKFKSKNNELLFKDDNYWHLNISRVIEPTKLTSHNPNIFFRNYTLCKCCSTQQQILEDKLETLEAFK